MEKDKLIKILKNNQENIEKNDWNAVYENMDTYDRGEFSEFLIENDIDPNTMFKGEIPEQAFFYCKSLTSIKIPNNITSISNSAFACCSLLEEVIILNSVTSIGRSAFSACSRLTSITIPNNVTKISNYSFSGCSSLKSITIPNNVTEISDNAFWNCQALKSITIPDSVTKIGRDAFKDCQSLTEIKYDGTQEEWNKVNLGKGWISGCPVNKKKNKIIFLK